MIATVKALHCADAVTQENATTLHVVVHGEEAFDSIIDAVRNKDGKITSMANLQPSLEDVFLTHNRSRSQRQRKRENQAGTRPLAEGWQRAK